MPLYEYHCSSCGLDFEKVVLSGDGGLTNCPDCGTKTEKRVSAPARIVMQTKFTKDGEGFTSKVVSKQEADERARANAGKYD